MVLEALVNPKKVTGRPWELFFIGALYSLFGAALGFWVFRSHVSLVMVTFTTIASIPFVISAITSEERKGRVLPTKALLKEHGRVISMFTFLFLGFVMVFIGLFVFLPERIVGELFFTQIKAIADIRGAATGSFFSSLNTFGFILLNNFKVLLFCILFSLFYGSGAIFILSWNASVMGAAIGATIRGAGSSFQTISSSLAGYFVHGIPEIVAYFIAALAGGIISVAILREKIGSPAFRKVSWDAVNLIAFAVLLLIVAAIVEVTISPYFL